MNNRTKFTENVQLVKTFVVLKKAYISFNGNSDQSTGWLEGRTRAHINI